MAKLLSLLVLLCLAVALSEAHRWHNKGKFGRKHPRHGGEVGDWKGAGKGNHGDLEKQDGEKTELAEETPGAPKTDINPYAKHRFHGRGGMRKSKSFWKRKGGKKARKMIMRKMKKRGKKQRKFHKKNQGWMKYRSESECQPECEQGELCILGPLSPQPMCVKKKHLKKSMKVFHHYQKKEKKEWKKFQKKYYGKKGSLNFDHPDLEDSMGGKFKPHHGHHSMKKGIMHRGKPAFPPSAEHEKCSPLDFRQMRTRMMGWFHVMHGQSHLLEKQEQGGQHASLKHFHKHFSVKKELREHQGGKCQCFKSALWQFNEMDMDKNDLLTPAEVKPVEENMLEPCVQPYLTSCDLNSDGNLTSDEWCCCFSHVLAPCHQKLREIKESGDMTVYIPRCDREGYYMREQCRGDPAQPGNINCWCVDYNGNTIPDSQAQGRAHCSKLALQKLEKEGVEPKA